MMNAFSFSIDKVKVGILGLLWAGLVLGGCSAAPIPDLQVEPPLHPAEEVLKETVTYPVDVYDPIEGLNRRLYRFNYYFDKYLYLPVVKTYAFIVPDYVEDRVTKVFDNIYEINNLTNSILQLKGASTGKTMARIVINSTVGIGGLWDPAGHWGIERQDEDFGQTLGHYGVGNGPFIVLPVFGPSNLRDAAGLGADSTIFSAIDPLNFEHNESWEAPFYGTAAVDRRHRQPFRYFQSGSPFEYEMIRFLYAKKRELQIAK